MKTLTLILSLVVQSAIAAGLARTEHCSVIATTDALAQRVAITADSHLRTLPRDGRRPVITVCLRPNEPACTNVMPGIGDDRYHTILVNTPTELDSDSLVRIALTQCYGGGCCPPTQPYYSPAYPSQPQQTQPAEPPKYEVRPTTPAVPAEPPKPAEPSLDMKQWLDWLEQQKKDREADAAKLDAGFKSIVVAIEANKCNCQPTDLAPVIAGQQQILAAISNIKVDVPAPQPTAGEQHIVVVADHNAPYWQRLSDAITTARKTYSGIQDTTLPTFPIGIHPQAVVYRDKVPVRIVKGQNEVEALLSRASRGESL